MHWQEELRNCFNILQYGLLTLNSGFSWSEDFSTSPEATQGMDWQITQDKYVSSPGGGGPGGLVLRGVGLPPLRLR